MRDQQERGPMAFGAARVSTDRQARSGLGLDAQDMIIKEYFARAVKPRGVEWGELVVDAISAFKRRFGDRPEARRMLYQLQRGDHVIVAKLDRAFRDTLDYLLTAKELYKKGIILHVVDQNFDSSDPIKRRDGKMMLTILAAVAERESEMNSQRQKDINAVRRLQGRACSGRAPKGFMIVGPKGNRRLAPDPDQRQVMQFIVREVRDNGLEWWEVARKLRESGVRWLKKSRRGVSWEFWSRQQVERAYWRMLEIEAAESRNPALADVG